MNVNIDRVQPQDIQKGDRLWESSQYGSIEFEVIDDPEHKDGRWAWAGRTRKRGIVEFLIVDGYEHYGPRIYRQPVYIWPEPEYLNQTPRTPTDDRLPDPT